MTWNQMRWKERRGTEMRWLNEMDTGNNVDRWNLMWWDCMKKMMEMMEMNEWMDEWVKEPINQAINQLMSQ